MRKTKVSLTDREKAKRLLIGVQSDSTQLTEKSKAITPRTTFTFIDIKATRSDKQYFVRFIVTINSCVERVCSVEGPGVKWAESSDSKEAKFSLWDEIPFLSKRKINFFVKSHFYGEWDIETTHRIKINGSYDLASLYKGPTVNGFGTTIDPKRIMNGKNLYNHLGNAKDDMNKINEYLYFLKENGYAGSKGD